MLHTFSPNWYRPQCLHITKSHLYYASNYLLYQYNLAQRKVTKQLCLRQVAIQMKINFKDIKILSIVQYQLSSDMDIQSQQVSQTLKQNLNNEFLYVAINQPYAFLIQVTLNQFKIEEVFKLEDKIPDYLYPINSTSFIFATNDGSIYSYNYQDKKITSIKTPSIKITKDRVKQIIFIQSYFLVFYLKGNILVFDKNFQKILKTISIGQNQSILNVDTIFCPKYNKKIFAILSKNKQIHFLTGFSFQFHEQFPLQFKKKLPQIAENLYKVQINIHYPKRILQKLKQSNKAALTIKLISGKQCIVSGKVGQIYTLFLDKIIVNNKKQIDLKSFSNNEQISQYQVWPDSKHYKDIFCMKSQPKNNTLYFLGTDHILSIWQTIVSLQKNESSEIKSVYSIKFLTTGVSNIFFSEADPRTIFLLLRDSIVRSFSPLQEGNHHLNQYWKYTKKNKVTKVAAHLKQMGVLGLLTNQNKIILYDVYQDRLIKTIQFQNKQQIISVSFQNLNIEKALNTMYCKNKIGQQTKQKSQQIQSGIKISTQFDKNLDPEILLCVQFRTKIVLIKDLTQKVIKNMIWFQKDKKLQRLDKFKYWNNQILASSCNKNNILSLDIVFKNTFISFQKQNSLNSPRVIFKYVEKQEKLYIISYKSAKMIIEEYFLNIQDKKLDLIKQKNISLQITIDHIVLDYQSYTGALYNQRDNIIQIIKINQQNPIPVLYLYSTKIQCLSFYFENYIIVGSKDQAIKVIKYTDLQITDKKRKNKLCSQGSLKKHNSIEIQFPQKDQIQKEQEMDIQQNNQEVEINRIQELD